MKLLYICTHNRCRSIIAEAVTRQWGGPQLEARSAGSQPSGVVHPLSLKYLAEAGASIDSLTSQSWDEHSVWAPDIVITVCDQAAAESCPVWFGNAIKVHWGLSDPSRLEGSEDEIADAFRATIATLRSRVEKLAAADPDSLDTESLQALFAQLGAS
ncbi:arsenate reductase ArsC [Halioglobus maricola]|uniref:Arsenate reductase ArsC n=1 Tax=Halioglobus maricola TaxID=2601894 RepID=A0A5P9NF91_9GAMM|nr:arsenate reductase ArsC [Halioglobus maricola]QFU74235.1 arsenate reductase ArsC [Halioglobus maricola]